MPYNPEAQFNAGLGLVGVQNVAQEIAEARKRYDENQKLGAYNDSLVRHAYQTGQISLDELNDYQQAAGNKKTGIAAGLAANMLDNHNREKDRQLRDVQNAQIDHLNAQSFLANTQANEASNVIPFQPSIVPLKGPDGRDYPVLMTSPHSAAPLRDAIGGDDATVIDPLIDPATKQPVPGMGVVRKTGAVTRTTAEQPPLTLSPDGKFYLDDKSKSWKPMSPAFIMTPGNESAAPGAATLSPQDQQAAAWAAANPGDPRAAAIKKKLGLQ